MEPQFEVIKFCQAREAPCRSCGKCRCRNDNDVDVLAMFGIDKAKVYSRPRQHYTAIFQGAVDAEIEDKMSEGYSREEAVQILLQEENG